MISSVGLGQSITVQKSRGPKPLNPKTLNPKPQNPQTLKPKPEGIPYFSSELGDGQAAGIWKHQLARGQRWLGFRV